MFQIKTTLKHSVEYPKFDLMFENILENKFKDVFLHVAHVYILR
jgi:chemotaxis methyl-accepting protein methylase